MKKTKSKTDILSMRLTKGCYGNQTDAKQTPFGFLNEQMRTNSILNNAGWFNGDGEKLGFGDLDINDLDTIAKSLDKQDLFLVLNEFDTSWNMPNKLNSQSPSIDYVMTNCIWAIYNGNIIKVRNTISKAFEDEIDSIKYEHMPRTDFHTMIGYGVKKIEPASVAATPSTTSKKTLSQTDLNAIIKQAQILMGLPQPGIAAPVAKAPGFGGLTPFGGLPITSPAAPAPAPKTKKAFPKITTP